MRIKSYFAGTVEAAMDLARRELGEDAVLLNSRPAPPEARHLGIHEVVFGVEGPGTPAAPPPLMSQRPPALAAAAVGPGGGSQDGMEGASPAILARIERLLHAALLSPFDRPAERDPAPAPPLVRFLTSLGYPEPFAQRISVRAAERLARGAGQRTAAAFEADDLQEAGEETPASGPVGCPLFEAPAGERARAFAARGHAAAAVLAAFADAYPAAEEVPERRVMAFVGPPGAGRTSLVAKIAARASAWENRSTVILTTDTVRIGAAEQLRTYAGIMGAAFEVHETPRSLANAIGEHAGRHLVLIDTPGWSPAQLSDAASGAAPWRDAFARGMFPAEVHLVLPAQLSGDEAAATAARFSGFCPAWLALTRLDECLRVAPALAFASLSGLRLSWFAFGQAVPEDAERASLARWLDLAVADDCLAHAPPESSGSEIMLREVAHA